MIQKFHLRIFVQRNKNTNSKRYMCPHGSLHVLVAARGREWRVGGVGEGVKRYKPLVISLGAVTYSMVTAVNTVLHTSKLPTIDLKSHGHKEKHS